MPVTITKYRVFVASPSDVSDERASIKEVIDELNLTYSPRANVHLELVRWETHAAPGASKKGSQDVINKDVGDEYDLFIGLLWLRFGTATKKVKSGTEEEFKRAKRRFDKGEAIQILFYFKDSGPRSLRDMDPEQLAKVNAFRTSLGDEGVLHWSYTTIPQLQQFLRMHLPQRIESLRTRLSQPPRKAARKNPKGTKPNKRSVSKRAEKEIDELGTLDYQELLTESLDESTKAMKRIGEITTSVGSGVSAKAEEFKRLKWGNKHLE
ncbi:MAG: DUF4062 domain-containing protein [Flavobacteriales bacterium]|nr:DUF4062 domain-containing protein [Flavobacteriales bacterium]